MKPLSAESFEVLLTMGKGAHDKLRYAQELLSHQIPSGDVAQVIERALDALIPRLERARFAATRRPRRGQPRVSASPRHIPADVMQVVWERDGGQCTFVSEAGHRCQERRFIQFDHILAVARGGESNVDNLRLRCRAHNQFEAERTFGAEFMRHKRIAAAEARVQARAEEPAHVREVVPWLQALGFKAGEARRAAALCQDMSDARIEERVRLALSSLGRGTRRRTIPGAGRGVATSA